MLNKVKTIRLTLTDGVLPEMTYTYENVVDFGVGNGFYWLKTSDGITTRHALSTVIRVVEFE